MMIGSAILLATFGTILQLKPTCNFEENPSQTRDIMSKLGTPLENHSSRRNGLVAAMYHVHQ
jgi:hypothetical protein